ncbi:MAG: hypothetical protein KDE19_09555, partial [Caldilineaceae bacterium]|nr:hypothetical protein [Caldilineaceae bacterium]
QTCSDLYNSHCVDIFSLDPDGILTSDITGIARCEATAGESISNLMYFYPQPEPGINEDWSAFDFYHAAVNRMQYIYDKCRQAAC